MIKNKNLGKYSLRFFGIFIVLTIVSTIIASAGIGTIDNNVPLTNPDLLLGSIVPQISETGKITLSLDANGTNNLNGGDVRVQKPAGATVRKAFLAVATVPGNRLIASDDIKIDGSNVDPWDIETPCSISCYNYWKDVTSMVKAKIDTAPAGIVNFHITEANTYAVDGEILAVIFDDPAQTTDNTIILLFGAQNVAGDTFNIGLANPLDKSVSNVLDMSLGISFGYQVPGYGDQFSTVKVNNNLMTSSAGGQDDGAGEDGALITVGGIDDSDSNPILPADCVTAPRCDDEMYNLLPFVNNGDTEIKVDTINPSNDDNIFFAALNLRSVTAVVGQGIVLSPPTAKNPVGTTHTVTAKVQDANGDPVVGRDVTFTVISGPNAGETGTVATDATGKADFSYLSNGNTGTDMIQASFLDDAGKTINSNKVEKVWERSTSVPEFPAVALPVISILGMIFVISRRKN